MGLARLGLNATACGRRPDRGRVAVRAGLAWPNRSARHGALAIQFLADFDGDVDVCSAGNLPSSGGEGAFGEPRDVYCRQRLVKSLLKLVRTQRTT